MAEIAPPGSDESKERFNYTFQGRVVVLDNGAGFTTSKAFRALMDTGTLSVVSLDPKGRLKDQDDLQDVPELQIIPNVTLGDGQAVTFYACLDDALSSTLEPLPSGLASTPGPADLPVGPILARVPINSVRLDDLQGLSSPDWLILDALNDNLAILQGGANILDKTLVFDIQIPFQPTHVGQAAFGDVQAWMAGHGVRFLRFQSFTQVSRFPADLHMESVSLSDMRSARGLFIPTDERLETMPRNQLLKLSFLMHTAYKLPDLAYHVLAFADAELAKRYLVAEGYLWPVDEDETEFMLTPEYCPDIWAESQA